MKARMADRLTLGSPGRSAAISGIVHAVVIVLILMASTAKHSPLARLIPLQDTKVYQPRRIHVNLNGQGGGGQHSPLPPSKGRIPKAAPRIFTPPHIAENPVPMLPMPPAIQSAIETVAPVDLAHIGLPSGHAGPFSGGPGGGGGLGPGDGLSAGSSKGAGRPGDGVIDAANLPRKGATKPELLSHSEPEYSEEARRAKLQGTVALSIVVSATGQVVDIHVVRSLGLGLDDKAIEAVSRWQFRPATIDGKAVAVRAVVEVNFRLL